jgi:hypothetical protein
VTVTQGTDYLGGYATVTNLITQKVATQSINPLSNEANAATQIYFACGNAGVKCGLDGFSAVKLCGGAGSWQLDTGDITITSSPFSSD